MKGRVLIIAGSDSGGGAGIQADIKSVSAMGAFAATAITALTAQNTLGVHGIEPVSTPFLRQQIRVVLEDIGADAIKTGMLHDVPTILAVCAEIRALAPSV
ncbi:MAG: bifunctional hydroxymethylpyrimidine kinase/phosphomethylpyrimidine kinase, partial [Rhodospirillales bacterium]|nr:bifunctional hydroxymethylpyrimidine kinase/phosphomethylpyrimidine kinase [Rhodospirillales bacterium]